jgi:Uri superfamily endonuclease
MVYSALSPGLPRTPVIAGAPAAYARLLRVRRSRRVRVGRLGTHAFTAGHYLYVGSAFGPAGLRARITHHMKRAARPHWHVDYLRRMARVVDVRYVAGIRSAPVAFATPHVTSLGMT